MDNFMCKVNNLLNMNNLLITLWKYIMYTILFHSLNLLVYLALTYVENIKI